MSEATGERERTIREAFRLANDMHLDLIVATGLYRKLGGFDEELIRVGGGRLCLFGIVLTLAKWTEFYDRYRNVLPASVGEKAKKLKKEVVSRGIRGFRNTVVAHVFDKGTGRALTNPEVEQRLQSIAKCDLAGFLTWINDIDGQSDTGSVVQTIESIREGIKTEHGLSDKDLEIE